MTVNRHASPDGPRRIIHRLFPPQARVRETAFTWLAADPVFVGLTNADRD